MLFCDECGTLKKKVPRRGETVHICPKCEPGIMIPPGGTKGQGSSSSQRRPSGSGPNSGSRPTSSGRSPTGFQRADQLAGASSGGSTAGGQGPGLATDMTQVRDGSPPEGAGRYFPFPSMRKHQARFIRDVRQTLRDRDIMVAQAPTGIGKTAGVLAPALEVAKEEGYRIFFLTPKQSQHKVAVDTLRLAEAAADEEIVVSDMISKQAMCPRPESEMLNSRAFGEWCMNEMTKGQCRFYENDEAETFRSLAKRIHHVDEAVELSRSDQVCPYAALNEVARVADVVVLDYNHFFSDLLQSTLDRLDVELDNVILIIDEAHNLPDRIRDHLTTALHPALVADARDEARGVGAYGEAKFLEQLREFLNTLEKEQEYEMKARDLLKPIEEIIPRAFRLAQPDVNQIIEQLEKVAEKVLEKEAKSACEEVARFLELWIPSPKMSKDKVLRRYSPDHNAVVHQILDAAVLGRPIFDQVAGAVLMSGTLFPMKMYARILGVPSERTVTELYENPFPPENRRVLIDPGVSSSYRDRGPQTYKKIAGRIEATCQATPGNVAVFFPSYAFADNVLNNMAPIDRLMVNEERGLNKEQKESLVTQLRRADGNALLMGVMGGSLSEGYDFVEDGDNLLDAVLVVGIPYAPPTLEVKSLQGFYDKAFGGKGWLYGYLAPAMQRTLQAAGRAVRGSHHRAVVGLLDRRYTQTKVQKWLPPDMQPQVTDDLEREVRGFFGR